MRFIKLVVLVFFIGVSNNSLAEDKATPEDIMKKVHEAALFLSQAGDPGLKAFNDRNGPWVFKDTYVFVFNCEKGIIVAHPIKAKLIGRNLMGLKDVRGNYFFAQLCDASQKPGGGWVEYWWPKVDGKGSSRKISLLFQVPDSSYQVGAGIYDKSRSIEDLEKLVKQQSSR
ncbi:cache domain-containing protein [Desulfobacterales bacterium HSG2]|nr:cache domain-containing protein [Desulfobacterales bacterium HSG2]